METKHQKSIAGKSLKNQTGIFNLVTISPFICGVFPAPSPPPATTGYLLPYGSLVTWLPLAKYSVCVRTTLSCSRSNRRV